jgi:hypothetical protein
MKTHDIPKSGKRGNVVAFQGRFGQVEREYVAPAKRPTAAQLRAREELGGVSPGWSAITEEQRKAWDALARKTRSRPRLGQSGPLTGQNLFTKINTNQALLHLPPFLYPPERPAFGPNPVRGFSITVGRHRIALKLSVPEAPAGYTLVFGSLPCNAGRRYCDKFMYLGPLPASDAGESNITEMYVKKRGMPWPGSRVFIYTQQQVNGWRDEPVQIDAIVPLKPAPAGKPKRRPATVATP